LKNYIHIIRNFRFRYSHIYREWVTCADWIANVDFFVDGLVWCDHLPSSREAYAKLCHTNAIFILEKIIYLETLLVYLLVIFVYLCFGGFGLCPNHLFSFFILIIHFGGLCKIGGALECQHGWDVNLYNYAILFNFT